MAIAPRHHHRRMRSLVRATALAVLLTACHDGTAPTADSLFTGTATGAL